MLAMNCASWARSFFLMLRLSRRNCAIVLSGGLGRGDGPWASRAASDTTPGSPRRASWRMQRFQSRYWRCVDAAAAGPSAQRPSFTRLGERVLGP